MSWPIPAPGAIAQRYADGFTQAFRFDLDGLPLAETPDVTAPDSVFRVLGVVGEEAWTELYLFQKSLADELMVDTAEDWLPRHAAIWGIPRLSATVAIGTVLLTGPAGTPLPAGIEVQGDSARWITTAAATIPDGGIASVRVQAEVTGAVGNAAGGLVYPLVTPIAGLGVQTAQLDPNGIAGGTDIEDRELWRQRILARIRNPGRAGTARDYVQWAREAGAGYVRAYALWQGAGTVGVIVAMPGPRAPTPDELARIDAHIQAERPVTARVLTIAAQLTPLDVVLSLTPDTLITRAAAVLAVQGFLLREADIGLPLAKSRLDAAVSAASGEYAHRTVTPPDDVAVGRSTLLIAGAVTFVALPVEGPPA